MMIGAAGISSRHRASRSKAKAERRPSEHEHACLLRLHLRLNVDGDRAVLNLVLQRLFDPIANVVSLGHVHGAWNHQMELDEGPSARVARAQVVGLERTIGVV